MVLSCVLLARHAYSAHTHTHKLTCSGQTAHMLYTQDLKLYMNRRNFQATQVKTTRRRRRQAQISTSQVSKKTKNAFGKNFVPHKRGQTKFCFLCVHIPPFLSFSVARSFSSYFHFIRLHIVLCVCSCSSTYTLSSLSFCCFSFATMHYWKHTTFASRLPIPWRCFCTQFNMNVMRGLYVVNCELWLLEPLSLSLSFFSLFTSVPLHSLVSPFTCVVRPFPNDTVK